MKNLRNLFHAAIFISLFVSGTTIAAPLHFTVSTTVTDVEGSYVGGVLVGDTITGEFLVDDDKDNSGPGSDPGPGTNPGHEYTSFWEFNGAPYGVDLLDVQQNGSYSSGTQAIVVNDGLFITSGDTGDQVPTGTYDWIEILGATTSDYCPPATDCIADPNQILVADGEEWTLAIFSTDSLGNANDSWFSGGDIPQNIPLYYTAFLIGFDFDEVGNEIGLVIAPVDTLTITTVPVPAAIWLFGSGLIGLVGFARRKN